MKLNSSEYIFQSLSFLLIKEMIYQLWPCFYTAFIYLVKYLLNTTLRKYRCRKHYLSHLKRICMPMHSVNCFSRSSSKIWCNYRSHYIHYENWYQVAGVRHKKGGSKVIIIDLGLLQCIVTLKEKRESFWPKKLSHWMN